MAEKMMVYIYKLDSEEIDVVKKMAEFWLNDPEIEELTGWNVKSIRRVQENLPYVEPDEQMVVSDMITFFWNDTETLSDRVMDSLKASFGDG